VPSQRSLLALAGAAGRSTADKMAKEQSERSVVAGLAPVCAHKFRALPDAEAETIALSKVEAWKRGEEFPKEIVTLPGETIPELRPCVRVLYSVACAKVSCAPVSEVSRRLFGEIVTMIA
jgi:hypothetical protein